MDDRIKPTFSVPLEFEGEKYLIDRRYDHLHIFRWVGMGIFRILTAEGLMQMMMGQEQGEHIAEQAMVTPIYREEWTVEEREMYYSWAAHTMDDDWLGGLDET